MAAAVRHELGGGWAEVAERDAHPALRPYVRRYWGYVEEFTAPVRRRELPSRDVVLILSLGPTMELRHDVEGAVGETHTSFVAGLTEASVVTEMPGRSHGLQVNLTPLGAYALFAVPMHTLSSCTVSLEDLLGADVARLVERLHDAPAWDARFTLLDDALRARLARGPQPSRDIAWAWSRLLETGGRVSVGSLAAELGRSRKHLAIGFRDLIGLAPKAASRVLRFERAVDSVLAGDATSWARIAHECGYYDQAHFNRDFRRFAGSTPTEFVARQMKHGLLGLAPE